MAAGFATVVCAALRAQEPGGTATSNIVLTADLVVENSFLSGLTVAADNIEIDGNGYAILCVTPPSRAAGISVSGHTNVTIRNLRIAGFSTGVQARDAAGLAIGNCRIEDNIGTGISLTDTAGAVVSNSVIREPNRSFQLYNAPVRLENNVLIGARHGITVVAGGAQPAPGSFAGNRLLHQPNDTPYAGRRRLLNFTAATRQAEAGDPVEFSFALSSLTGESAAGVTATVRSVPERTVSYSRNGNTVTGHFVPAENGLHSLYATATDTHGNVEERVVRVFVGPVVSASIVYYMRDWQEGPLHGQAPRMPDVGNMKRTPPTGMGGFWCGAWVDWYADEIPPPPVARLQQVEVKTMLEFLHADGRSASIGIHRLSGGGFPTIQTAVPSALGTGQVEWGEFNVGTMQWTLDYPHEWLFMALSFTAPMQNPRILAGNPLLYGHTEDRYSRTIYRYAVPASPEVRAATNPRTILLSASTAADAPGSARLTVWGYGDETDLTLGNFPHPFFGTDTLLSATGETVFGTGPVSGERTFETAPMTAIPAADAVRLHIETWSDIGSGRREWTLNAAGEPGAVAHHFQSLRPGDRYRVSANAETLTTAMADSEGRIGFGYDGTFPVSLALWSLDADSDGDGIPDWWEETYFGGPTNAVASDTAANGVNTLREAYAAGLNPTNPASRLAIAGFAASPLGWTLGFDSAPDRMYAVDYKDDLTATNGWIVLTNAVPGDGSYRMVTDFAPEAKRRFYRIRARLSP